MDDRFDQEFYTSEWQRVLPLGPHGIQPYLHGSRSSRSPVLRAEPGRFVATLGAVAQTVVAVGRLAALGMAKRPASTASIACTQRRLSSLRLAHETTRPVARRPLATRRPSRAA